MRFDRALLRTSRSLLVLALGGCAACSVDKLDRLERPEDPTVTEDLNGIILVQDSMDRVIRIDVPSLAREVVLPREAGGARALSNVDDAGEFVLAQYRRPWQMMLVSLDTKVSRVVASSDQPVRDYQIGAIALTADGTRAALAWDAKSAESGHRIGHLEIVMLEQGETSATGLLVCSQQMSWLPGGRELVVEVLLPTVEAGAVNGNIKWSPVEEQEGFVSGVVAFDPDTRAMRALAPGHAPVLSADGSCVLSRLSDGSYVLTDVDSGSATPLHWPGNHAGPIAIGCGEWVVYIGLPTEGRSVISTRYYSPMMGPRELPDVKLADLATGGFTTLFEGVDLRHALSFSLRSSH